ncbi:MAG: FtsX-like permease family protein [Candidatus Pacebacteria bacterium]|nr:FtsX-like permease family protein [Candidatus Paceibacterota bacterium]
MNIMLVSVTERIKEIGLRKSVGARKKDIMTQFLLEAVLLTLVGGILGIIVGAFFSWLTAIAFTHFLGISWDFLLPISAIVLGVGVSGVIGLVFGIYPAQKAANLSSIDALRYE